MRRVNHIVNRDDPRDDKGRWEAACGKRAGRPERKGRAVCNACVHVVMDAYARLGEAHEGLAAAAEGMADRLNVINRASSTGHGAFVTSYRDDGSEPETFRFRPVEVD